MTSPAGPFRPSFLRFCFFSPVWLPASLAWPPRICCVPALCLLILAVLLWVGRGRDFLQLGDCPQSGERPRSGPGALAWRPSRSYQARRRRRRAALQSPVRWAAHVRAWGAAADFTSSRQDAACVVRRCLRPRHVPLLSGFLLLVAGLLVFLSLPRCEFYWPRPAA